MVKLRILFKKKSIKNGMWLYFVQIFNTVIPLLTLPYITRVLGSNQFGVFSIAINIIIYLQVIIEYGFGMSATRKVAISEKSIETISIIFTTVFISRLILFVICIFTASIYIILNMKSVDENMPFIILLFSLLGFVLQQTWLFQGMQDMKYSSLINITIRFISVLLTFIFVKSSKDLLLYCILYSAAPLISGIAGLVVAKIKYKVRFIKININEVLAEMKSGWYVFTTQLSSKVFGAIGITFLAMFASETTVGMYSAIQKIPSIILLMWTPLSQVMYPISSQKMKESFMGGKKFVYKLRKVLLPIFVFGAIIISLFSKQIVEIAFGIEYTEFHYWIIPLLLWMLIAINNNFWGIQILLGSGRDKEYSRAFQFGVISTVLINFGLIFIWGGNGAALAPLVSEILLGIALYNEIYKLSNNGLRRLSSE